MTFRASKPTRRQVSLTLNAMRAYAPEGKDVPELKVRAARTYDPSAGSEHKEQAKVIAAWDGTSKRAGLAFKYGLPLYALFAIPNAARRGPQLGAWMKAEGLRAGIPDLCLAVSRDGFGSLYLEMKYGRNQESEAQSDVLTYLKRAGFKTATCWTAEAAIATIEDYLTRPFLK